MFKRLFVVLSLLVLPALAMPASVYAAQENVDVFDHGVCNNGKASDATICKEKSSLKGRNPISGSQGILTRIIDLLTAVVGIIAVIVIILAGLKFVTSGSSPDDVKSARERVIYALVALVIAGLAQFIVRFIVGNAVT